RPRAEGRVQHGLRAGPRAGGRAAAHERVHRFVGTRPGHHDHCGTLEVTAARGGAAEPSRTGSVSDQSQVGEGRRTVATACRSAGLDETDAGRASIVATEAATNLLKHAHGGEIVVSAIAGADGAGVQLLALDSGPGIADVGAALADGHSTAGTVGT